MRTAILTLLLCSGAMAHTVSVSSNATLNLVYGAKVVVTVNPIPMESCLVTTQAVEIVISTPLLAIQIDPGAELTKTVNISAARHPAGGQEDAGVQLNWAATGATQGGLPDPGCTGSGSVLFSVRVTEPIKVSTVAKIPTPVTTPTDPVSIATGEYFFEEPEDLYLGGPMPLQFSRYYASNLKSDGSPTPLGDNWSHNFLIYLRQASGPVTVTDNRGREIVFQQSGSTYTASGAFVGYQLTAVSNGFVMADPVERRFFTFNSGGLLTAIEDRSGNRHSIAYTGGVGNTRISAISDGLGRSFTFNYDSGNRITSVSDGTRTVAFTYTGSNLTAVTDVRNNVARYAYDTSSGVSGLITAKTMPRGNIPNSQTYDSSGRTITQSDGDRNVTRFAYNNGTTVQTNPAGRTATFVFNSSNLLQSMTDEQGTRATFTHDSVGRRTSDRDSLGNTTQFTFDTSGNPASITLADGTATQLTYASQTQSGVVFRNLTRIAYPSGDSVSYVYDANGRVTSMTDRAGATTTAIYNSRGQAVRVTNPAGGVTTLSYNQDGTVSSVQDVNGATTAFTYDALWRVTSIARPNGASRRFTWDAAGNLLTDTDERGKVTRYAWDANGNLASLTDPLGNQTTFAYDAMDRAVTVTDPLGARVTRTYDSLGRVATRTDRNGGSFNYSWDVASRLIGVRDPGGNLWQKDYDAEGFVQRILNPLGNATTATRDAVGRTTRATSATGGVYTLAWDRADRLSSFTDPGGVTTLFSADSRGDIAGVTTGTASVGYARGELGLINRMTDGNGQAWSATYDSRGRMLTATDPLGNTTTMSWDSMNWLTGVTFAGKLGSSTITRDPMGNITRKLYSDGTDLAWTFDDAGRVTSATGLTLAYDAVGEITSSNGIGITRDSGGRIATMTLAPGKALTYTYDQRNLVTRIADWAGGNVAFAWDAAGRMSSITRSNGVTTAFTYNADGAVTGLQETGRSSLSSIAITRDGRGRVTGETRNLPSQAIPDNGSLSLGYDANSQLSGVTVDEMGRLTKDAGRSYTWDLASRLASYSDSTGTATNSFDAFGHRTSVTRGGVARTFVWNYALDPKSISVVRQGGADLRYYIHTPDGQLLYSVEAGNGARRFYHYDEAGNTIFLTDDSGAVTDSWSYTPFGTELSRTGTTDNPFTFQGRTGAMRESASGLYYMRARFYDASTARFISRDPAAPQDVATESNPYGFARSNPLLFSDPTGLWARVHNDGVHSDMVVDVWENGAVIGTLNVSFGEGGYRRKNAKSGSSSSSGSCGSSGGVLLGGEGSFVVTFTAGKTVRDYNGPTETLIRGTREQDERMGREMLRAVDWSSIGLPAPEPGQSTAAFIQARRKENKTEDGRLRNNLGFKLAKGSGDWDTYGVFNGRTCNTFTGTMLNNYLGTNYSTGVLESSVRDAITQGIVDGKH